MQCARRLCALSTGLLLVVGLSRAASAGNMLNSGQALEQWGVFRDPIITPNAVAAPDGAITAEKVTDSATQNGARIFSETVVSEGGPYVVSGYLKAGTISKAKLAIADGSGGSVYAYVEPALNSGWQRFSTCVKNVAAGRTMRAEIYVGRYDKDNGYIYAWGIQLEPGTTPSAYSEGGSSEPAPPLPAPAGLTVSPSGSSLQVSWNAVSGAAGYRLQSGTTATSFTDLASLTATSYQHANRTPGVTYYYRVASVNAVGEVGQYSAPASGSVPVVEVDYPPAAPSGLKAVAGAASIQVSWNSNSESNLAGYRLERAPGGSNSFALLSATTATSVADGNVSAGSTYRYRVCAVDDSGQSSAASAIVEATVPQDETPPPPTPTGALNVLDFGANPASGGDDAPAIQKAFDAANTQKRNVYFPAGHYWLSRTVAFRADGYTVFGAGMDKSIIAGDTTRYSLLQIDRADDTQVSDLRFEGAHLNSDTSNTWKAVECYASSGTTISRIYAYGTGYIVFDNGGTSTTLEDSVCEDYGRIGYLIGTGGTVRRCVFKNREGWRFTSEMQGVYASAGKKNITIEDNEFINCGIYTIQLWGSQNGVWTENILIQRNTFTRCARALVVAAGGSGPLYRNVRFIGNTIRQSYDQKSIHIGKYNGSNADGTALLIEDNTFEDPGPNYGIFVTPWGGAPISGLSIRRNTFLAPNRSSYHGMVRIEGAKDVIIEDNVFAEIGHDGSSEINSTGVYLKSGSNIAVRGNTFAHWTNAGKSRTIAGVVFEYGAQGVSVSGNTFDGNGYVGCYGLRVPTGGSSANGSITNNLFRRAKFQPGGVPQSGNTLQ